MVLFQIYSVLINGHVNVYLPAPASIYGRAQIDRPGNARIFAQPYLENIPGMDITAYIAKEAWLKANPDVALRFKRAIDKATTDLTNAPKEERDGWVAKFTGVKPELVAQMTLPVFTTEFNMDSLKTNLDLAVQHKVVKTFDVNRMMWKP